MRTLAVVTAGSLLAGGCVCGPGSFSGWGSSSRSSTPHGSGAPVSEGPTPVPDEQVIEWRGFSLAVPRGARLDDSGDVLLVIVPGGSVVLRLAAPGAELAAQEWTFEWRDAPDGSSELHASSRRVGEDGALVECEALATDDDAAALVARACISLGSTALTWGPVAEAAPPPRERKPTGPDYLGLELGAWLSVETQFHECTNPEGLSVATFAGLAVRPDGYHGLAARAGASVGAMEAAHGDGGEGRWQLWGSLGYQALARFDGAGFTISPIVTWSRYESDVMYTDPLWGGGLSLDMHVKLGHQMWLGNLRMYGDAHGLYASWAVGAGFIE